MGQKSFKIFIVISIIFFGFSSSAFGFQNSGDFDLFDIKNEVLAGVRQDLSVFCKGALYEVSDRIETAFKSLNQQVSTNIDGENSFTVFALDNIQYDLAQTSAAVGNIFERAANYFGTGIENLVKNISSAEPIVFDGGATSGTITDTEALQIEKEKFNFIRRDEMGGLEGGYTKLPGTTSVAPVAEKTPTETVVRETREVVYAGGVNVTKPLVSSLGFYTKEELDSILKNYDQTTRNDLLSKINNLSAVNNYYYAGNTNAIALTNKIDSLTGVSLTNATVSGISGLTDSDIPDGITVSGYLPLSGGNVTGNLGVGTTSPYAPLSVDGEVAASFLTTSSSTATSTFAYGINLKAGCFAINGVCVTGDSSVGGSWSTTSADYYINSSSTIPKSYTENVFTASTTFGAQTNMQFASSSALTVTGNSYLGNISSGVWNGTEIGVAYGGTGTTTAPLYGQMLLGNNIGGYSYVATSSLGLL
ncbi:MAG TPA: hypothetical protein P5056_04080, partial [Candidatus Paceibacterota bacterium]|nr:hypothetical protein [Candidatus Paceibacterota bacterium]